MVVIDEKERMERIFGMFKNKDKTKRKKGPRKIPKLVKQIQAYKPPFINFAGDEKVISHTQLTIFNQCRFRWGLQYRDKKKIFDPSINLIFGIAMHEALQKYLEVYYNESITAADKLDLNSMFKGRLIELYTKDLKKNKGVHYSNPDELHEFYTDGVAILEWFKKKKKKYFDKRGWYLVGCEIPIDYQVLPNVSYRGHLDVVMYHEPTNTIEIIDLKTATKSWGKWQKSDQTKLAQLILYKKFFSELFDFPIDNINVKFLILKRKLYENIDYVQNRVQEFVPASGKIKIKKSWEMLERFAHAAFDEHGNFKDTKYKKEISDNNCKFCPYKDEDELCSKGNSVKNPFDIY